MKNKKKPIIIIAVILVIAIIVGAVFVSKGKSASKEIQESNTQTEEITVRDLSESVGATGTVVSLKSRSVTVALSEAEVKAVNVSVGDTVKKNDTLVTLDVSDAEESLSSAKTALNNAEERNNLTIADAERQLENAKKSRDEAKEEYDEAQTDYENAVSKLNKLKEKEQTAEVAAQVTQQQEVVNTLKNQVKQLKSTYENAKSSVAAAESSLKSAKLSADTSSQEAQVKQYQAQVDNGVVKAPFDGTITAVNYEAGEKYTAGTTLLTIQDCSAYEIEAEIGEYDISNIAKGQTVLIKTDATGDLEMTGKVTYISPVSSGSQSSTASSAGMSMSSTSTGVTYGIRIAIDNPSDKLRLDMTANLSIIIESHEKVLTVPYNAVYTNAEGQAYIKAVGDNGDTENINVEVVMESNYYTEIRGEGIQSGMKVLAETTESEGGFSFPQGGGF